MASDEGFLPQNMSGSYQGFTLCCRFISFRLKDDSFPKGYVPWFVRSPRSTSVATVVEASLSCSMVTLLALISLWLKPYWLMAARVPERVCKTRNRTRSSTGLFRHSYERVSLPCMLIIIAGGSTLMATNLGTLLTRFMNAKALASCRVQSRA